MKTPSQLEWIAVQESIRASGSPRLRQQLDAFHARYLGTDKHCWVPAARQAIADAWKAEMESKANAT